MLAALKQFVLKKRTLPAAVWRRLGLIVAGVLAGLFVAELAVRLFALGPPAYEPRRTESRQSPYIWDSEGFLRHPPNFTFAHLYDAAGDTSGYLGKDGRIFYRINNLGFRGPDVTPQKPAGVKRIICLGDSFTFGEGVREPDTYPARLQKMLGVKDSVEVINAGVSTWGTAEEVSIFKRDCLPLQPDIVILGFVLNDAIPLMQQGEMNEATAYQARHPLRVTEIVTQAIHTWRVQRRHFAITRDSFKTATWEGCKDGFQTMSRLAKEHNFRFVVAVFPWIWSLDESYPFTDLHALVMDACRQADCEALDLLDAYKGHDASELWVHPRDHHPNKLGHKIAADELAHFLSK